MTVGRGPEHDFAKIGSLPDVSAFRAHLRRIGVELPCDDRILAAPESPLAQSWEIDGRRVGNRFAIQPMEGWDGTPEGLPSEHTRRRWQRFGESGAKLMWGGEAVAVRHDGRANPNQLLLSEATAGGLAELRDCLLQAHQERFGTTDDLLIGLQLTHSGRFCKPNSKTRMEPRILYRHPILDRKFGIPDDYPLMTDGEIRELIEAFHLAARRAADLGFEFVDLKHCHGYLGHEFLSAYTREGDYGGSFENRTRFLREVVEGIRRDVPHLGLAVRLSLFDFVPFRPDPARSTGRHLGPGVPEPFDAHLPYRFGFGTNVDSPVEMDLTEGVRFLELLQELGIRLVNLTAGSPYYNPHIQRPALYPPSDGYQPPEDPLIGVARQIAATAEVKARFPDLVIVGTAYTYLQEYLPHVAQALVREGAVDVVGLGRMVLSYHDLPHDVLHEGCLQTKRICRTFSDCTTAPRNGLISGCFPLDPYYKTSPERRELVRIKAERA
jgi:2,4-dienoyl-CoA reductase-like NADH-dependent reductase (Old Yellow Enzyme family)